MADIRLLERTLAQNVTWNPARINYVAKFLVAVIQVRSLNLAEVAGVFAGGAHKESHYKRVQRFLRSFELPYARWQPSSSSCSPCHRRGRLEKDFHQ
jgi:hypothetical protein